MVVDGKYKTKGPARVSGTEGVHVIFFESADVGADATGVVFRIERLPACFLMPRPQDASDLRSASRVCVVSHFVRLLLARARRMGDS